MASEKTAADALRAYLTGVWSTGGVQRDPDASLGLYRSNVEVQRLGFQVTNPVANLRIDFVSGWNGAGTGVLKAPTADTLTWTPPSGTEGAAVTITNGQTMVLEAGDSEPDKYLRVTRTSASDLTGTATITLAEDFNNCVGFDDVSSAEAAAGDLEYRCIAFYAWAAVTSLKCFLGLVGTAAAVNVTGYSTGAVTVTAAGTVPYADWPVSGFVENEDTGEVMYYTSRTATALTVPAAGRDMWDETGGGAGVGMAGDEDDVLNPIPGIRIAKEAPTASAFSDSTADEDTQPGGLTWEHPTAVDDGDVIDIGSLAEDAIYGLWIERIVPVGQVATPELDNYVRWQFVVSGTTYDEEAQGRYRVANDALARYELYRGVDTEADLDAAAWETSATLPHTTAALDASHTYYFVTRYRNKYNLISQNTEQTIIIVDGDGDETEASPGVPRDITVSAAASGTIRVTANYYYVEDDTDIQADTWAIWWTTDGSEPDPSGAADDTETMSNAGGIAMLDYTSSAFSEGNTITIIVRARRAGDTDYDSSNTTSYSAVATSAGPDEITRAGSFLAKLAELYSFNPWNLWADEGSGTFIHINESGEIEFYISSKLVLRIDLQGNWNAFDCAFDNTSTSFAVTGSAVDVDFSGSTWRIFEPTSGNLVMTIASEMVVLDNALSRTIGDSSIFGTGSTDAVDNDATDVYFSVKSVKVASITSSAFILGGAWKTTVS